MSSYGDASYGSGGDGYGAREPGTRRKKLAGYLRAANELRQTYQQSAIQNWNAARSADEDDFESMPGSYPHASVARSGEEEMILFPSYARRHVKNAPSAVPGTIQQSSGSGRDVRDTIGAGDAEFWKQQWEQYEDDNAIVDVDVRGWVYTPHKGPLSRRARLYVGLARQMVGIPAPPGQKSPTASTSASRSTSPHPVRERLENHYERKEEELVAKEAEKLMKRGELEGKIADRGGYSEAPGRKDSETGSIYSARSNETSPTRPAASQKLQKRSSWTDPSQMTPEQLTTANGHLMTRLRPFLANPLANTPISAFFYNNDMSRQKTIQTDAAGHFNLRAALDFVPTHVRILASEKLSATKEVLITEPHGVSVISDIDDTIKHSAISSGAREIFRNVFLREFSELNVAGVKDWYNALEKQGVRFHYVSNSPWQLYPLLTEFFAMAGLPAGSFHLKAYNGVFQGLFEPVAERKKSTLERLMRDFPERRFLLIGDSGEADLEVYTDVVLDNPGRILGVFIRDVTTTIKKGFFDSAMGPLSGEMHKSQSTSALNKLRRAQNDENDPQMKAAIARSLRDIQRTSIHDDDKPEKRPQLPARKSAPEAPEAEEEDLIDLASEDEAPASAPVPGLSKVMSEGQTPLQLWGSVNGKGRAPPSKPSKPANLSSASKAGVPGARKEAPMVPAARKASTAPLEMTHKADTYRGAAREKLSSAYNSLPSWSGDATADSEPGVRRSAREQTRGDGASPGLPPRNPSQQQQQQQQGYAAMAAQSISSLYNSATGGGASSSDDGSMAYGTSTPEPISKKEELWRRRWARAKDTLDSKGVMLRAWRVGEDVAQVTLQLVELAEKNKADKRAAK